MKLSLILIAILGVISLLVTAAPSAPQGPEIRDSSGNTWVRGWSKVRYEKLPDGKLKYTVRSAPGKKIMGTWKQEGMEAEAGEIDFLVIPNKNTFELQSATMGGGIEATFNRPSSNAESKEFQTAVIRATSADYSGLKNTVDVKGTVSLLRSDPGAQQTMSATGSSGLIQLSKPGTKGANVVQEATLNGPVAMKLQGTRRGDDGKPQKYDVVGSADKMVFNDAKRTIVFTGKVKISGDDPSLGGQISGVSRVVITFAASGEVESIDMEGDPTGVTQISDKRKGGGKR